MKERIQFSDEISKNISTGVRGAGMIGSEITKRMKPLLEDRIKKIVFDLLWKR